jgi:hypothetical protein
VHVIVDPSSSSVLVNTSTQESDVEAPATILGSRRLVSFVPASPFLDLLPATVLYQRLHFWSPPHPACYHPRIAADLESCRKRPVYALSNGKIQPITNHESRNQGALANIFGLSHPGGDGTVGDLRGDSDEIVT